MIILYNSFDETLEYAVSELTTYVARLSGGRILPTSKHVFTLPEKSEEGVVRLGLLSQLGLPEDGVEDALVDDVIDINIKGETGYIAGSNIRSILLGVYRYLRSAGARWLRPGIDGEYIPVVDLGAHSCVLRHAASLRYRGECIEGAISFENVADTIIWSPRVGLNMFFMEQIIPYNYISRWYLRNQNYNPQKPNDFRSFEEVGEYTLRLEKLIKKCGLQLHAMGHGYLLDRYGIHYRTWADKYEFSELALSHCAMLNGVRKMHGTPNFTQLCYSNPEARRGMVEFCCDYLAKKPYIDFLHVWLADDRNNHCECSECQKKIPSDFYVMFLNELDEELTKRGIDTRLVFILYNDTVFPPETEKLNDTNRFVLLTAFTRDYGIPYSALPYDGEMPKYQRNNYNVPADFRVQYKFYKEWQKQFHGDSFIYEYYFYVEHFNDLGYTSLSPIIREDTRQLIDMGFKGLITDQTQRSFFPNGLPLSALSEGTFDKDFDLEAYSEDYYAAAYGEAWRAVKQYFTAVSDIFEAKMLRSHRTVVEQDTGNYTSTEVHPWRNNPDYARQLEGLEGVIAAVKPLLAEGAAEENACRRRFWEYLALHTEYVKMYADALHAGAAGDMAEARRLYGVFISRLEKDEDLWQPDFDLCLFKQSLAAKFR